MEKKNITSNLAAEATSFTTALNLQRVPEKVVLMLKLHESYTSTFKKQDMK